MRLVALAVGKKHDASIAAAVDDYTDRLRHHTPLQWQLLPSPAGKMSQFETKRVEAAAIVAQLQSDDYLVLLDERGAELTSRGVAGMMAGLEQRVVRRVVFVIGGAYGAADEVVQRADFVWSLSRLTLPHQLVRLVLAEQLYRAGTIQRGEPYHHG